MKWTPHGFGRDVVEFTWLDLLKLLFGKEIQDGALIAKRSRGEK